eukprot:5042385-Pleurochrysis_carterae.AAC.1
MPLRFDRRCCSTRARMLTVIHSWALIAVAGSPPHQSLRRKAESRRSKCSTGNAMLAHSALRMGVLR